jgi:hypothetical protein
MAINNNVEKRLEGKGDLAVKEGLMKLAEKDKADLQFDLELDIIDQLKRKYELNRREGETFSDYIKRENLEELITLELSDGGKVISLSSYLKQKEKPKIKKIDLAQGDFEKTVADLSDSDRNLIKELLRRSGVLVGD